MGIELSENYLSIDAEIKAKEFAQNNLDKNQLRKFYDDFKLLERKIHDDITEDKFKSNILPLIKLAKSKIAYNAGRKVNNKPLVPKVFKDHLDQQINNIKSIKDFQYFLLHFQAIIGYFTYFSEIEKATYQNTNYGGKK